MCSRGAFRLILLRCPLIRDFHYAPYVTKRLMSGKARFRVVPTMEGRYNEVQGAASRATNMVD